MTVVRGRAAALATSVVDRLNAVVAPAVHRLSAASEPVESAVIGRLSRWTAEGRFGSPWLRSTVARLALPVWFASIVIAPVISIVTHPELICFDCRLYMDSTRAWLAGGDPWLVTYRDVYFAAPPITLIPLVPFTLLPQPLDWQVLGLACLVATVATIRMLRLPWWWLLFPPVVQGAFSGNIQMLLIPLMLTGGGWLASTLKIYATIPLAILGQWRQLAIFAVILVVTIPFLPWGLYLQNYGTINTHLVEQTGYGLPLAASLVLLVPSAIAIAVVGRERGAWLAVPALWPSQQWYYASLSLPARSALVGAIIAVPVQGSGALALFALALYEVLSRRHRRRTGDAPAGMGLGTG